MAETAELALFDALEEYVARAIEPLQVEIASLRAELANRMKGDPGEPGKPGDPGPTTEVDYDRIGNVIAVAVEKAVGNIEKPKDGVPGKDAIVDYSLVKEFAAAAAVNALAALPRAKDGEPGKDADESAIIEKVLARIPIPKDGAPGDRGADGNDGRDAVVDEDAIVERVRALIPVPKDGINDKDGEPGRDADPTVIDEAVAKSVAAQIGFIVGDEIKRQMPTIEPGLQAPDVEAVVARAVAAIPTVPVFDPASIMPLIDEAVEARVKAIEIPSVDEAAIAERVRTQLPTVKDGAPGRDFDPDLMRAEIGRLFAEMPKPESVHPDTVAVMVRDQVTEALKTVRLPEDGKPGRDALDLEILESIDEHRSYPVGTFALHDGGTLLALRDTDPLAAADDAITAGWKVTQDGIKDMVREETEDERVTRVVVRSTSGRRFAVDCVTASGMQDQGVYRPGMKYRSGDCVTFDESYWTARRDTAKSPPGEDWRLILKGKRR